MLFDDSHGGSLGGDADLFGEGGQDEAIGLMQDERIQRFRR
jgi:hypothetical protein